MDSVLIGSILQAVAPTTYKFLQQWIDKKDVDRDTLVVVMLGMINEGQTRMRAETLEAIGKGNEVNQMNSTKLDLLMQRGKR